jgi:predicted small integral membrane protein
VSFASRSWLGVAVVALHNLEEAATAPIWLQRRGPDVLERFGVVPFASEPARLYAGLAVVTLIAAAWVGLASRGSPRSIAVHSLVGLFSMWCVNAFVPHLLGSVWFREYTPGVVSAVGLVIPYGVWYFRRALVDGWVSRNSLAVTCAVGAVLYVPALQAVMAVLQHAGF